MQEIAPPPKTAITPHFSKSIVLHAVAFGLICFFVLKEEQIVLNQELALIDEIRAQEEKAEEDEQKSREESLKDMLREQMEFELDDLIADELERDEEEKLKERTRADLVEHIDDLSLDNELLEMSQEELDELLADLRVDSFEELRRNLEELMKEMLLAQVRNYIRERVAPRIRDRIEREVKSNLGEKLKREVQAQLERLTRDVERAGNDRRPEEIQRALAVAAMEKAESKIREEIGEKVKSEAIPATAEKITRVLDKDLKRMRLDSVGFKEFVKKDIRRALDESLEKNQPDTRVATLRVRQSLKIQDSEEIEAARAEVQKAIRKLEQLKEFEGELRRELSQENIEESSNQQSELAFKIGEARQEALGALRNARNVTVRSEGAIKSAERELNQKKAEQSAKAAAEVTDHGQVDEGKKHMAQAEQHLDEAITRLKNVEQVLAREAAAAKVMQMPEIDLAELLGDEEAESAVEAVQEAAGKVAGEEASGNVARAVNGLDFSDMMGNAAGLNKTASLRNKLDQVAQNVAEGRETGATAIPGAGVGIGAGLGPPGQFPIGGRRRGRLRFDREAYKKFIKDLKNRLNPDNYYKDIDEAKGLDSEAENQPDEVPAKVFVDTLDKPTEEKDQQREVPLPDFKYKAFGAASMVAEPISIDGDLSDWGEMRHPMPIQYEGTKVEKIKPLTNVYMRWSPDGLYFCYKVRDTNGIQPCPVKPYEGDCLEVWIDMVNSRLKMMDVSAYAHQFCFMPFGYKGAKQVTFAEIGRNQHGLKRFQVYPDSRKARAWSAVKILPGYGYQVEAFLKRRTLAKPSLIPGKYIAVNFSVNVGFGHSNNFQWSASKEILTWNKPDTWGDVLLLGADAKARFVSFEEPDEASAGIVPGHPLAVEITDQDMNINTFRIDRIAAEVKVKGVPGSLFVVLRETGKNTGQFRCSVSTQQYFLPAKENTLSVRSGDTVEIVYRDARSEYGEKNRLVKAATRIGWPMIKLGQNQNRSGNQNP